MSQPAKAQTETVFFFASMDGAFDMNLAEAPPSSDAPPAEEAPAEEATE